jgi:hypothetical protein
VELELPRQSGIKKPPAVSRRIPTFRIFCLQINNFFEVDPRGVESLTSTVQRRREAFIVVRGCSESRSSKPYSLGSPSQLFAGIRPSHCQRNCHNRY